MISTFANKTSSAARFGRATFARRLKSSTVETPAPSPPAEAAKSLNKAVQPNDPKSVPRALVWITAAGLIGAFAGKAFVNTDVAASERHSEIKTMPLPSASSMAKSGSESMPQIEESRSRYDSIGKEGLGIDHRKTGKRRTTIAKEE